MTLENIDKRLSLYSEYLSYYSPRYRSPMEIIQGFHSTGIMYGGELLLSFNQWLGRNGYYDLIDHGPNVVEIDGHVFRRTEVDGFSFMGMIIPEFDY